MTTTRDTPTSATMLAADSCMAMSPEGEVCPKAEYHTGLHSWQASEKPSEEARQPIRTKLRAPTEEEFDGADFLHSPALDRLAQELIDSCYELEHLQDLKLAYLWKRKGGQAKGKPTWGKCQKPTGLLAHFAAVDFAIWLPADHAIDYGLSAQQLEALLFHELCHTAIEVDEKTDERKITTVGHDVEEFSAVIRRYGLWEPGLQTFADTIKQLTLDEAPR